MNNSEVWNRILATQDRRQAEARQLRGLLESIIGGYKEKNFPLETGDLLREMHAVYQPKTRRQRSYFNRLFHQFDGKEITLPKSGKTYVALNTGWRKVVKEDDVD